MKAPPFGYVRATSLAEALELLEKHGPDARLLAGGQSLIASLAFRLSEPTVLIDISRLDDLRGIHRDGDTIRIGAGTTHAQLGRDAVIAAHASLLHKAVPLIAHAAIRNRGTIGGSIAYADPASELPACCVALDAAVVVRSKGGVRRIAAREFFTGLLTTALDSAEIIEAIEVPVASPGSRHAIEEVTRRSGDYAMAGFAASVRLDGARVADARLVGFGIGETPVAASSAAAALVGRPLDADAISAAQASLNSDIDPPADPHGSSDTKRHLARVVLGRALRSIAGTGEARAA
ncbi:MAG TPA: xanthine dehydrogenase family protein subunit M [Hyphomicrobiaceae bacterium]|nr:xanthine dehydrogenase family protein subunit M [Hyphomicrobiaceae bacterium]